MGFVEGLTLVFIILKLAGVVGWSWFTVFLPELIMIAVYIVWFGILGLLFGGTIRSLFRK